jgi:putative ABC transport system permease protein
VVWLEPGSPVTPAEVEQVARATLPVAEIYREWSFGEWTGADGTADPDAMPGWPNVLVPEEKICPYWDRAGALSQAEQRVAAQDPRCAGSSYEDFAPDIWVVVDDGTTLPALTGGDPADLAAAAQVLRDGGAVVSNERFLTGSGEVIVGLVDDAGRPLSEHAFTVPGYLLTSGTGAPAVISHEVARTLGWELERGSVLATTERMPSQAEEDAFIAALAELGLAEGFGHIAGRPFGSAGQTALVLLAIAAGLVALGAAAIATGLAAADRRGDLSTLGAVGASPRVRRLLSLNQSGVVAGLGTVLGLAAGLGASVAVLVGMNQQYDGVWPVEPQIPITVPWLHLVGLLAVPVVAMLGAGLLTRSRLPIERRLA